MTGVVVSDTSPVRALNHLGLLDVLPALFGQVVVPPSVVDELANPRGRSVPVALETLPYVLVRQPRNADRVAVLRSKLDAGEAEAIVLAVELGADELLMDERIGRRHAEAMGLHTTGVLAVLLRAKRAGLIPAIAAPVDRLRAEFRFFMTDELRADLLGLAGE